MTHHFAVEILVEAEADANRAVSDIFDAVIAAYGLEAVRRMAIEKTGGFIMQGKRVEWNEQDILKEGEYAKAVSGTWYCCAPGNRMGNLKAHAVTEHEDGTITVSPSILITAVRGTGERTELWHGYLEHGVWRQC